MGLGVRDYDLVGDEGSGPGSAWDINIYTYIGFGKQVHTWRTLRQKVPEQARHATRNLLSLSRDVLPELQFGILALQPHSSSLASVQAGRSRMAHPAVSQPTLHAIRPTN